MAESNKNSNIQDADQFLSSAPVVGLWTKLTVACQNFA